MSDLERESLPPQPPLDAALARSMLAPFATAPLPPRPDVLAEGTLPSADPVPAPRVARQRTRDRDATLIVRPLQDELDGERRPRWWIAALAALVATAAAAILVMQAIGKASRATPPRDLAAIADAIKPTLAPNVVHHPSPPKATRPAKAADDARAGKTTRIAKATTATASHNSAAASTRKAPPPSGTPAKITTRATSAKASAATIPHKTTKAKDTRDPAFPKTRPATKTAKITRDASAKPAAQTAKVTRDTSTKPAAQTAKVTRDTGAKPAAPKVTRGASTKRATQTSPAPGAKAVKPAIGTTAATKGRTAKPGAAPRTAR